MPSKAIFCSSVAGHGIPLGVNFNDYMKNQIEKPKLVFLLMTPSYMESAFCLMELGAAWAQASHTIPIVVPPVPFEFVTKTLGLIQAWNIEKHTGLNELRAAVNASGVKLEARTDEDWDAKRTQWRQQSKAAIKNLHGVTKVAASEHEALLVERDKLQAEVEDLESQLDTAAGTIEKLKLAKSAEEVRSVMREVSGAAQIKEQFEELLSEIKKALPDAAALVRRHIIMDHYGKASQIDWFNDRAEFEAAIQRNLIDAEDNSVRWDGSKLRKLGKALGDLDAFLAGEEGEELAKVQAEGVPMEADDIEFWTHHLHL